MGCIFSKIENKVSNNIMPVFSSIPEKVDESVEQDVDVKQHLKQIKTLAKNYHPTFDYRNFQVIGRGSFGVVFSVNNIMTNEITAIKQIKPNISLKNVIKEIEIMKNFQHPNLVNYICCHLFREKVYIVMEYLIYGSLKKLIQTVNFEPNHIAIVAKEVLQGLFFLHSQVIGFN